jgi:hypothetical protein
MLNILIKRTLTWREYVPGVLTCTGWKVELPRPRPRPPRPLPRPRTVAALALFCVPSELKYKATYITVPKLQVRFNAKFL